MLGAVHKLLRRLLLTRANGAAGLGKHEDRFLGWVLQRGWGRKIEKTICTRWSVGEYMRLAGGIGI
jgi:hypothetical protein